MNYNPIFSEIKTPEAAWFLGWLYSDGSINGRNYNIAIEIHKKDSWVIKKFGELIPESRYFFRKNRSTIVWYINSKMMTIDLSQFGIIPNKHETIKPVKLDRNLRKSFWQGVWEGDGFVLIQNRQKEFLMKNNGYEFMFGLSGNEYTLNGFKKYMGWNTSPSKNKLIRKSLPNKEIFNDVFCKIYENDIIKKGFVLPRKYGKMNSIKNKYNMVSYEQTSIKSDDEFKE